MSEKQTEKQLRVSSNLMEEESAHVPPENILNEELETLIMASIQILKCSNNRGVPRNFLEGGSKSSKMSTTGWPTNKIFGYGTAKTVKFGPFSMRFHVL